MDRDVVIKYSNKANVVYSSIYYFLKTFNNTCISTVDTIKWKCKNIDDCTKGCVGELIVPQNFIENFKMCKSNRKISFVFGFLHLISSNVCPPFVSHLNAFLIDIERESVEIFEPHGDSEMFDNKNFIIELKKFFLEELGLLDFYETTDFCPDKSFQILQQMENEETLDDPTGFCQSWSIWWINYRLENAHRMHSVSINQLVREAINKMEGEGYTKFIRKYAAFIVETRNNIIRELYYEDPELLIQKLNQGDNSVLDMVNDFLKQQIAIN